MSENIKCRYALDRDGSVVDVFTLTDEDRRDYLCLSCGEILRPVLGKKRRKHFRHNVDVDCSAETYLHGLGKALFRQHYQRCLDHNEPFEVEFLRPRVCIHCDTYGPCELEAVPYTYDLTNSFCYVATEVRDKGLVPDVLLMTKRGEKLYVEVAVTHLSTADKRHSGNRIIELSVECEEDLDPIRECRLSELDPGIELINFEPEQIRGSFPEKCTQEVHVFVLWPSGKSRIQSYNRPDFEEDVRRGDFYHKAVAYPGLDTYVLALERAYRQGHTVKNCFLCRYHARVSRYQWRKYHKPIFCKFLKKPFRSNGAADCEYYRPDESVFRYHESEKDISIDDRPWV